MAAPMDEAEGGRQKAEEGDPGPGAALYGNFTNYYRFNPPAQRLRLLPAADLAAELAAGGGGGGAGSLALDVGCNTGDFSVAVYKHLCELGQDLKLLGCDIDTDLIQRATDSNPYPESIWYLTLDVMDPVWREAALRPHLDRWQRASFDICFCMSVTMWIHLHHGDRGLLDFLRWVSGLCRTLLIEPQPWKCYRSAARRLRKLGRDTFDHFKTLTIKGDVAQKIQQFLVTDCNMELVRCFGNTNWDRSLLLFKKCSLN